MKQFFIEIINLLKVIGISILKFFISIFSKPERQKKEEETSTGRTSKQKYFTNPTEDNPSYYNTDNKRSFLFKEQEEKDALNKLIEKTIEEIYEIKIEELKEEEKREELDKRIIKIKEELHPKYSDKTNKEVIVEKLIQQEKEKPMFLPPQKEISTQKIENQTPRVEIQQEKRKTTEAKEAQETQEQKKNIENTESKKDTNAYTVAIPTTKKLNLPPTLTQKTNRTIKQTEPKEKIEKKKKEEIKPIQMIPTTEKRETLHLKNEITNILLASTVILTNISKELLSPPKEETKKLNISSEKTSKKETSPSLLTTDLKKDPTKQEIKPEEKPQEKKDTKVESKRVELEQKQEEVQEQTEDILEQDEKETKEMEELREKIDSTLTEIENFIIQNEEKLTEPQKETLSKEKEKLYNLKYSITAEEIKQVEKEKQELENSITNKEIDGLKKEIQKMDIEHKMDLQELKINSAEELNQKTTDELAIIEKNITKKKLRKAMRVAEISSIFALPFVRNKYFFFFTTGLFINNHFRFLSSTLNHQDVSAHLPDMNALRQGKDALHASLDMTIDNLNHLEYIKQQALSRYPELKKDHEFMVYLNNLEMRLNRNYERLMKKQEIMEQQIYKTKRAQKILKKQRKKGMPI